MKKKITATIQVEMKPFLVPNFALYGNGSGKESIPLKLVPSDTLYDLCKHFVEDVYAKAEKPLNECPMFIKQGK